MDKKEIDETLQVISNVIMNYSADVLRGNWGRLPIHDSFMDTEKKARDLAEIATTGINGIKAHIEEQDRKLNQNKCNSGHTTLPVYLWQCPVCVEIMEERYQSEITRLRDALEKVLKYNDLGRKADTVEMKNKWFNHQDEIAQSALDKVEDFIDTMDYRVGKIIPLYTAPQPDNKELLRECQELLGDNILLGDNAKHCYGDYEKIVERISQELGE